MAAAFVHVQHDAFPEVLCSLNEHGILVTNTHTHTHLQLYIPWCRPLHRSLDRRQCSKLGKPFLQCCRHSQLQHVGYQHGRSGHLWLYRCHAGMVYLGRASCPAFQECHSASPASQLLSVLCTRSQAECCSMIFGGLTTCGNICPMYMCHAAGG